MLYCTAAMSPISREPANEAGRSQAWEKTHLQWASDKLKFVKRPFKLSSAGGHWWKYITLEKKESKPHCLNELFRSNPKIDDKQWWSLWSNLTIKLFTKNTNHLLGQQLGGWSVDFVDSYRKRKGKKQGEGKIKLEILRHSTMTLPFSHPLQLICFSLISQLRQRFLHLSTRLADGQKSFKSSKSIISHFSILSVLVAS